MQQFDRSLNFFVLSSIQWRTVCHAETPGRNVRNVCSVLQLWAEERGLLRRRQAAIAVRSPLPTSLRFLASQHFANQIFPFVHNLKASVEVTEQNKWLFCKGSSRWVRCHRNSGNSFKSELRTEASSKLWFRSSMTFWLWRILNGYF